MRKILIKFEFGGIVGVIGWLFFHLFLFSYGHHHWLFGLLRRFSFLWQFYFLFFWRNVEFRYRLWFFFNFLYFFVGLDLFIGLSIFADEPHLRSWFGRWLFRWNFLSRNFLNNLGNIGFEDLFGFRGCFLDFIFGAIDNSSHDRWFNMINWLITLFIHLNFALEVMNYREGVDFFIF